MKHLMLGIVVTCSSMAIICRPALAVSVYIDQGGAQTIADYNAAVATDPPLNVLGLNSSGVLRIRVKGAQFGFQYLASGFLLSDKRHVVTAAHVLDKGSGVNDNDIMNYRIRLQDEAGGVSLLPTVNVNGDLTGQPGLNTITVHPNYVEADDAIQGPAGNSYGGYAGYDIAIIDLGTPVTANVAGYSVFQGDPLGRSFFGLGYGPAGPHTDPASVNENNSDRYYFRNVFSDQAPLIDFGNYGVARPESQIAFDFDAPAAGFDFFGDPDPVLGEGITLSGDSGGPLLVSQGGGYAVASIASWRSRTPNDTDPENGTPGEIGVGVDFAGPNGDADDPQTAEDESQRTIADWIIEQAGLNQARGLNPNGGSFAVASNFAFNNAPQSGASVTLNVDTSLASPGAVYTPAPGSSSFTNIFVGGGAGVKSFSVGAGESVTITETLSATTNGLIRLTSGDVTTDRLVVDGTTPVPVSPTPARGAFIWDQVGQNATSLTANEVLVRNGGDYVHRTITGTTTVDKLTVESGGYALIETIGSFDQVINSGSLDLGPSYIGNYLSVGTGGLTQNTTGAMRFVLGGTQAGYYDQIAVNGTASLAGNITLTLTNGFTPALGDVFDLIFANSVTGVFDSFSAPTLSGGKTWALYFGSTLVWSEVVASAMNMNTMALSAQSQGNYLLSDFNGDGLIGEHDFAAFAAIYGVQPASLYAATVGVIPEPATLLLLGAGGLLALGRRRS